MAGSKFRHEKIKKRERTNVMKSNVMSASILDKEKLKKAQEERKAVIDVKAQNESMLKKFKTVNIDKDGVSIQSIQIKNEGEKKDREAVEEPEVEQETTVSSLPGKGEVLFFSSTFNYGQRKI